MIVLPLLAVGKRRSGRALSNRTLIADSPRRCSAR